MLVAGGSVVLEEYLDGPEVSLFCVSDGVRVVPLEPAQDFKRALDDDEGPNTGGMGAYSPLPWAPEGLADEVVRTVAQPTVDELAARGIPFTGILYCGLALTARGLRVVEFNARFGDPETQVVLERLASPLGPLLLAAAQGDLGTVAEQLHDKVLFADADMNKADWTTAIATIAGVLGVGMGLWWADAVAALLVSVSILRDGVKNLRASIGGLTDAEARTFDDSEPHPLTLEVEERAGQEEWVEEAAARVRDQGHVFHAEVFVVPRAGTDPTVQQIAALRDQIHELDWKLHDVVVAPVPELPGMQTFRSTLRT